MEGEGRVELRTAVWSGGHLEWTLQEMIKLQGPQRKINPENINHFLQADNPHQCSDLKEMGPRQ